MKKASFVNRKKLLRHAIFFAAAIIMIIPLQLQARELFYVGKFSTANPDEKLPEGWKPLIFKKIKFHTSYFLVKDDDKLVIKAISKASASGLIRKVRVDPEQYPIIKWQWKAANILRNGDVTKKNGDDYPARLYILFEYDPTTLGFIEKAKFVVTKLIYGEYPPTSVINYIWANKTPVETIVSSPYTDRSKIIVVESGKETLNTWIDEERNIFDDYVAAFGVNPPMISGIAIMTDSDNTRESATAFYGDILFKQK